jgi:hypothetical protein
MIFKGGGDKKIIIEVIANSIRAQIRARFADSVFRKSPKAQKVMSICEKQNRRSDHQICAAKRVCNYLNSQQLE